MSIPAAAPSRLRKALSRRALAVGLFAWVLAAALAADAAGTDSVVPRRTVVAVMELRARDVPRATASRVRDSLVAYLGRSSALDVVPPARMDSMHDPRDFVPLSECSETPCAVRAGHKLGADLVVIGRVEAPGAEAVLRVVDVESEQVAHEFRLKLPPSRMRLSAHRLLGMAAGSASLPDTLAAVTGIDLSVKESAASAVSCAGNTYDAAVGTVASWIVPGVTVEDRGCSDNSPSHAGLFVASGTRAAGLVARVAF